MDSVSWSRWKKLEFDFEISVEKMEKFSWGESSKIAGYKVKSTEVQRHGSEEAQKHENTEVQKQGNQARR